MHDAIATHNFFTILLQAQVGIFVCVTVLEVCRLRIGKISKKEQRYVIEKSAEVQSVLFVSIFVTSLLFIASKLI